MKCPLAAEEIFCSGYSGSRCADCWTLNNLIASLAVMPRFVTQAIQKAEKKVYDHERQSQRNMKMDLVAELKEQLSRDHLKDLFIMVLDELMASYDATPEPVEELDPFQALCLVKSLLATDFSYSSDPFHPAEHRLHTNIESITK